MKTYLVVKSFETDEIVEKIDVTGQSERSIDRTDRGLNINLNHEEYYTAVINEEQDEEANL